MKKCNTIIRSEVFKKYKFSKNQCNKINKIYGNNIKVEKMGQNRTAYLHFLYDNKNVLNTLIEYNEYIDNIVLLTMKYRNCGLSDAKKFLNLDTKKYKCNNEIVEGTRIDHYNFIAAEGMVPVMKHFDKSIIERMDITRFIGQKWPKLKNENSPIIQEYKNKEHSSRKRVDDIMKVVMGRMCLKEFNKMFPLWIAME